MTGGTLASTDPGACKCNADLKWEAVPDQTPLTCRAIVDVQQTVVLYNGLNYFSLWVDVTGTRITDILNTIPGIQQASLSVFNTRGIQLFVHGTESNGKFSERTQLHTKDGVYLLNVLLQPQQTSVQLTVTGAAFRTLGSIGLIVGENWLPVVFDTIAKTDSVMPIQTACTTTTCNSFRYIQGDAYEQMFRNTVGATSIEIGQIVSGTHTTTKWNTDRNFARGRIFKLTLVSNDARISGSNGRVPVQLTDLQSVANLRANSYSTVVVSMLHLRSLHTTTSVVDPTFCPTKKKTSNTDDSSCECELVNANRLSIPWPRDECNKCVFAKQENVCDNMGGNMELAGVIFAIHARPPDGYAISSTSTAVAKLKRSFSPTGNPLGVKYEHLSIRSVQHPVYSGCRVNGTHRWTLGACDDADKLYVFTMPMAVLGSEIEEDNAARALEVNFEFDIGGVKFVTRNTERLNRVTVTTGSSTNLQKHFNVYETTPYPLELQKFQIICPLNRSFVSFPPSVCPFEGEFPTSIVIDPTTGDDALKNFDPEASNRMAVLAQNGIRLRGVRTGTSFVLSPAQNLSYVIKRMPGIVTYVTVHEAVFDQCEYGGVYKFLAASNMGCDPNLIQDGTITPLGTAQCSDTSPFLASNPRIIQTDTLNITRVSGDRQTRTVMRYNKHNQVGMPTLQSQYVLSSDDESLEINVRIDANDCVLPYSSTRIHITISNAASVVKVDRLAALGSEAQKCVATENCMCKNKDTKVLIGWPVDECNECVLDKGTVCSSMGTNFADQGITYFMYIENTDIVRSNSMGVVKLKNSRRYDANSISTQTGVRFPHLSIRDFKMPTCAGCYQDNRAGLAVFGDNACNTCAAEELKIFFFQLTAAAISDVEIAVNAAEDTLAVNFEFSIAGKLYVTKTTKPLVRVLTNGQWRPQHDLPNTLPSAGDAVRWPQRLTIHPKLFGIVCSLGGQYTCPYEGDDKIALVISAAEEETTPKNTSYSFRTIAGGSLYVRLDVFHVDLCSKEAVYAPGGNPNYPDEFFGDITYEVGGNPVLQTDQLKIVHYSMQSSKREAYQWSPGNDINAVSTTSWELSNAGDLLEIHIANDGYYCGGSNQFEMRFSIQNTPFQSTAEPCAAGYTGAPGSCLPCTQNTYKATPGNAQCLPCAINSVPDAAKTACVCAAAQGWQKTSAVLFACEQVSKTITQRFELSTPYQDFVDDKDGVRTGIINVLATAYATIPASISLEYHLESTPNDVQQGRRRLLSQLGVVDKLIVTAQIITFHSIVPPADTYVQQALQNAHYTVKLLDTSATPANNGSNTPLLWIVVFCGVFCMLGISVCIVVYVRSHQQQREASQTQQDHSLQIEANQKQPNITPTPPAYETQTYMPPYYDPHSQ